MDDDNTPDIQGGFGKSYRKEFQSEVWLMPPLYHRVWYWIRMNVQYERFLFPTRKRFGIWVLPGQKLTSLQEIAEAVKWTEWGSEKVPNKKTITGIIHWLESREMVTVESNGKGTLVTVINWHSYNKRKDEKVTAESNAVYPRVGHKEEGKEVKKESKTYYPKPRRPVSPDALRLSEHFEKLWKAYPGIGKRKLAERHYRATVKNEADMDRINYALGNYQDHLKTETWKKPQNGETWFNNWQDWEPTDGQ